MADDTRLDDLGRAVANAADHAGRVDGLGDDTPRVDALNHQVSVRARAPLGVPPRDSVLGSDDRDPGTQRTVQRIGNPREAVGIQYQEHDIGISGRAHVISGPRMGQEVTIRAEHPDTMLPDGGQMGAAGDQVDLGAGTGEAGAHVPADGPRADDGEPHGPCPLSWAAIRFRCTLPVGVRGISRTTCMTLGTLKSASDSRHLARSSAPSASPFSTTAAPTTWPYFSSSIPKHTASATAGCAFRTASTSSGEMFSPPRMISSLIRPCSRRYPSSSRPRSPVRNQPLKKDSAFAWGRSGSQVSSPGRGPRPRPC